MCPCISKSKRKQAMSQIEDARKKVERRPLDNYERARADEVLGRDGVPEVWVNDEMRMQDLIRLGLRKGEHMPSPRELSEAQAEFFVREWRILTAEWLETDGKIGKRSRPMSKSLEAPPLSRRERRIADEC